MVEEGYHHFNATNSNSTFVHFESFSISYRWVFQELIKSWAVIDIEVSFCSMDHSRQLWFYVKCNVLNLKVFDNGNI